MDRQAHWYPWIIVFTACGIYLNTLNHEFTQDDAIVIYLNSFTTQGVEGIPGLISNDTFTGFFGGNEKSNLVSGGRYRPFTPVLFALLWQIFGDNPFWFHLFTVLSFGLLSWVLFKVLSLFDYPKSRSSRKHFAFIATLLFVLHPIHTEAIANIKGADEIYSLLWSLVATWLSLKYIHNKRISTLFFIGVSFFLALLSKESALVFIMLIPVSCWYFIRENKPKRVAMLTATLSVTFILYILLRISIVGIDLSSPPPSEMMNNPFIKFVDGQYLPYSTSEKWSSIITGLGKYIQLLFFPHPLTNDYYPRSFPVENLTDPAAIMAAIMHVSLVLIALLGIRKKSFISFIILFFYASIFTVSNILFPIGTHISERFLFTPSISICLLFAYGWIQVRKESSIETAYGIFLTILIIAFGWKTYNRNQVWANDYTLFTTDVEVSKNSAKARNAAGGALITRSQEIPPGETRDSMLYAAIDHLSVAIEIHPRYKGAHLLRGNAHTYLKEYYSAVESYETAVRIDPYYDEAFTNLAIASREAGRYAGSVENDIQKAKEYLFKSMDIDEENYETLSLLGIAFGNEGNHNMAIEYFEEAVQVNPEIARAYVNLGRAYLNAGNEEEAQIQFQRAVAIDPQILNN